MKPKGKRSNGNWLKNPQKTPKKPQKKQKLKKISTKNTRRKSMGVIHPPIDTLSCSDIHTISLLPYAQHIPFMPITSNLRTGLRVQRYTSDTLDDALSRNRRESLIVSWCRSSYWDCESGFYLEVHEKALVFETFNINNGKNCEMVCFVDALRLTELFVCEGWWIRCLRYLSAR